MRKLSLLFAGFAATFAFAGCQVDDSYDFSNVNTETTLFKGLSIPVGNVRRLSLDELFDIQETEYFIALENGDYCIHVPFNEFSFDVPVPLSSDQIDGSGISYSFSDFPEFMDNPDNVVQIALSGVEVSISVDSGLPGTMTIGTSVDLSRNGVFTRQYQISDLSIAPGNTDFVFSEAGSGTRNDVVYKKLRELDSFFSPVPDMLIINDFHADIPADVASGQYGVTCQVTVDSPVAFSADSHCDLTIPIENASVDLNQVGLKKAVLSLDAYNSVPLEFSLSAVALDGQGNHIEGITAQTDVPMAAGTTDSPVCTPLTVTLTTNGDLRFQGLELHLHASSNASVAGVRLNKNQGIELKNLVITIPDGITVTL